MVVGVGEAVLFQWIFNVGEAVGQYGRDGERMFRIVWLLEQLKIYYDTIVDAG
jgi:hypothetical protein